MKNPNNKFYVGHAKLVEDYNGWRDKTLNDAISRAKRLMQENGTKELLIVKVVAVVKIASAPVEVIKVK